MADAVLVGSGLRSSTQLRWDESEWQVACELVLTSPVSVAWVYVEHPWALLPSFRMCVPQAFESRTLVPVAGLRFLLACLTI